MRSKLRSKRFQKPFELRSDTKGCKYINVIRDPLDAAYSSFKFMEGWYLEPGAVSPDDFVLKA